MSQQRKTQTKLKIKAVFTDLINEKGFDNLTVSDISRQAGINRGTFYLHYLDKYDLLEQLEDEIIHQLNHILLVESSSPEFIPIQQITHALYFIREDFAFVQAIASKKGDPHFQLKLKQILSELLELGLQRNEHFNFQQSVPEDYARAIVLSNVMAVILLWIEKGGIETPEFIASLINHPKFLVPKDLLG